MLNISTFNNCQTVAEIKSLYRKLAKEYHPDYGGSNELMGLLTDIYKASLKSVDNQISVDEKGKAHYYKYKEEVEDAIIEMIIALLGLKMENVDISLIGVWIWITGNTKPYKDTLMALGCKWHGKRKCWFYHDLSTRYFGSNADLSYLAQKYGCTKIEDLEKKQ